MSSGRTERLGRVPGVRMIISSVVLWICTVGLCMGDSVPVVTAEDYARAERFLFWNKDRYVVNDDIQHHWIEDEDSFWYRRTIVSGEQEFVRVAAASGQRSPAFDHSQVAAALSRATGSGIDPRRLPFATFRYVDERTAIQFLFAERLWTCELRFARCTGTIPQVRPDEIPSPNGAWRAVLKASNVWLRAAAGHAEIQLTRDGHEHYGYASGPGYSTRTVTDARSAKPIPPQVVWSPDSRFLLTHRLDERRVKDLFLVQAVPDDRSPRPRLYTYRYALPGDEDVPLLEPIVFDIATLRQHKLAAPPIVCPPQTPIEKRDMWWSADSRSIYYLDRDRYSKWVALNRADAGSGDVKTLIRESNDTLVLTGASSAFDAPLARTLSNGDIIWYSQRDGWGHLYYYDRSGALRNQITRGEWGVREIVRIDEAGQNLYFMAAGREAQRDPYQQYLYSIRFDGTDMQLLTPEEGHHARARMPIVWAAPDPLVTSTELARFSASGRYFVDSYSRPDSPSVLVLRDAEGRLIKQLEQADISKLRAGGYSPVESFTVTAADGKTLLYGNLFRPSHFDANRKYPIIDASYPGPQLIRSGKSFAGTVFDKLEAQSLAELGFVVVTIDGRGTPGRSRKFLEHSYGRLDKASELADHVSAIRQLAARYSYLDLLRVGVDGASGGGAMAAQAILTYPDFYKVAVSAEGVHDQRGYMAAWGEAYIGPVAERDYEASSTVQLAANLQGKLFLMHGEMDDNVSPALTMRLVDALIKANKNFDLLIIPNGNHAAFATSSYFIRRKWDYFVQHLLGALPPLDYEICQP